MGGQPGTYKSTGTILSTFGAGEKGDLVTETGSKHTIKLTTASDDRVRVVVVASTVGAAAHADDPAWLRPVQR